MLSGPDILVIVVVALVLFGPKKLPELGKAVGETLAEFKSATEKATNRSYYEPREISHKEEEAPKKAEKAE